MKQLVKNQLGNSLLIVIVAFLVTALLISYLYAQNRVNAVVTSNYVKSSKEFQDAEYSLTFCKNKFYKIIKDNRGDLVSYNAAHPDKKITMKDSTQKASTDNAWFTAQDATTFTKLTEGTAEKGYCFIEYLAAYPTNTPPSYLYRISARPSKENVWVQTVFETNAQIIFQ